MAVRRRTPGANSGRREASPAKIRGAPEALQECSGCSRIPIHLDVRAFERAGVKNIDKQPVTLTPQTEISLRIVLGQLPQQAGATIVVREGVVIVVPRKDRCDGPAR